MHQELHTEPVQWRCHYRLAKYWANAPATPYEVIEGDKNGLTLAGARQLWRALRGDTGLTPFANANAAIGVGNGTAAFVNTQTNLVGTSTLRKGMDAGFPKVGTADGLAADNQIQFQATFQANEANFDWYEWGIFNATTGGLMLNRKQEDLGRKTSAAIWVLTITLSLG